MLLYGYYAWNTQAKIPQSPSRFFRKNVSPSTDEKSEVTKMATALSEGTSETTRMTVRVTEFDVVYYRNEDLLFTVHQIHNHEIPLRDISDALVHSPAQSFRPH